MGQLYNLKCKSFTTEIKTAEFLSSEKKLGNLYSSSKYICSIFDTSSIMSSVVEDFVWSPFPVLDIPKFFASFYVYVPKTITEAIRRMDFVVFQLNTVKLVRVSRIRKVHERFPVYLIENENVEFMSVRGISLNNGEAYLNCFDEILDFMENGQKNIPFSCIGLTESTRGFIKRNNLTRLIAEIADFYVENDIGSISRDDENRKTVNIKEGEFYYDGISETMYTSNAIFNLSVSFGFYKLNTDEFSLIYTLEHIFAYRDLLILTKNDTNILSDPLLSIAEDINQNKSIVITYSNMFDILKEAVEQIKNRKDDLPENLKNYASLVDLFH